MEKVLIILKQRRLWASFFALLSISLRAIAPELDFNEDKATELILTLIQTVSDLGMVLLPVWSYFKPRK